MNADEIVAELVAHFCYSHPDRDGFVIREAAVMIKELSSKLSTCEKERDEAGRLSHQYRNTAERLESKLSSANGRADFNETRALQAESRLEQHIKWRDDAQNAAIAAQKERDTALLRLDSIVKAAESVSMCPFHTAPWHCIGWWNDRKHNETCPLASVVETRKRFGCDYCSESFDTVPERSRHEEAHNPNKWGIGAVEKQTDNCVHCGKPMSGHNFNYYPGCV